MALVQNDNHIFFLKHKGLYETDLLSLALADGAAVVSMKTDLCSYC